MISRIRTVSLLKKLLFSGNRKSSASKRQAVKKLEPKEVEIIDKLVTTGLIEADPESEYGYQICARYCDLFRGGAMFRASRIHAAWKISCDFPDPEKAALVMEMFAKKRILLVKYLSTEKQPNGDYIVYTTGKNFRTNDFVHWSVSETITAGPKAGRNVTGHYLSPS
ncbi:MAG: hypothetical protein KBC81_02620 [Candidatus Pacebacteria bacterium]|nr:hypothetical protein [Candidatus Paceibacterota bacterium]